MLLIRPTPTLELSSLEWYMKMVIIEHNTHYYAKFYYKNNKWSEPAVFSKKNNQLIKGEKLHSILSFINIQKTTVDNWFEKETPYFLDYFYFTDELKLLDIKEKEHNPKHKNCDIATFEGSNLNIGIYYSEENYRPSFSFETENTSNFKHDWIIKKYPNLVRQIMYHHPKRLFFILH